MQVDGKSLLSDIIVNMKYARHVEEAGRRETWAEIVQRNVAMHTKRYPHLAKEIKEAFSYVNQKKVLPSMRSAQFAGKAIETKENRIYNCAYTPADSVDSIKEVFFNLLCGSGVGYSVQSHHVSRLPKIEGPAPFIQDYRIGDTIEGWCDSVEALFSSYMNGTARLNLIFDDIRPEGSPLKTSGGRAPGPEPLRESLTAITSRLDGAVGRKLTPLEVHDILCFLADAVHAGGIRRAAMICFFDRWDQEMLTCKTGNWGGYTQDANGKWRAGNWRDGHNPQRGRANNSAVFVRGEVTASDFQDFWKVAKDTRSGDPGIYWTWDRDILSNPCVEISLNPHQFCNLTTVNGATIRTEAEFIRRVVMATRIGTLQAGYTDFSYLRSVWSETTAQEALLGVSITGIGAGRLCKFNLEKAAAAAVAENARVAKLIGIRPAARVTCIKPEGSGSLVLGTPAGIHAWHSPFYFRSIRIGKTEPIYNFLQEHLPALIEDDEEKPNTGAILRMPVQANPEGYFRHSETALDLLERVKRYSIDWVHKGHQAGPNTHNISCTVSIQDHEWDSVGSWMWEERKVYNGLAFMPYWGGTHRQSPLVECSESDYKEAIQHLKPLDLTEIREAQDNTTLVSELACAGGTCELL